MAYEDQELSLDRMIDVVRKRWKEIVFPSILAAFIAAAFVASRPTEYQSYALVKIGSYGTNTLEPIGMTVEVMQSTQMRREIAKHIGKDTDEVFVKGLKSVISYDSTSGMLMVTAKSTDKQMAINIVQAASELIVKRHEVLYQDARKRMDELIRYVKETIRPVPLSSGINEFGVQPSTIEIDPSQNAEILPGNKTAIVYTTFVTALLLLTVIAFISEGRKRS